MSSKSGKYLPVILSLVLVTGIVIGSLIPRNKVPERLLIYPRSDKLNDILNYIEREYVDSVSKKDIVENIIPQVVEKLDPHSVYIPASQLKKYNEALAGNFSGIGIKFQMKQDTVVVIQVVAHGPSEKAGVLAGDRIVRVGNEVVAGVKMPVDTVVGKLRGLKASIVNIYVLRRGVTDTLHFEITRDDIPLVSIDAAYMLTSNIGYIKASRFSESTAREFIMASNILKKQGMEKMVIDLRGNGGGYLNLAITIADQFLEANKLIVYTEGRAKSRNNFYSTSDGCCLDVKLAIIIDEWTASASEILAGAIQDNDRGIIIGRRSFGKGLVQQQTEFSDGSALRLTIARYYTPTGRSIQKPYQNGNDEYYNDINQRFQHGEFYQKDSILLADTLKFMTAGGNVVFGGGGIMPDIFVPEDTLEMTSYFIKAHNKGLINNFAFEYTDNHRQKLTKQGSVDNLATYLKKQKLLDKFTSYAQNNGVERNLREIKVSARLLETSLIAEIVRNIYDDEGYFRIINAQDAAVERAIEELSK